MFDKSGSSALFCCVSDCNEPNFNIWPAWQGCLVLRWVYCDPDKASHPHIIQPLTVAISAITRVRQVQQLAIFTIAYKYSHDWPDTSINTNNKLSPNWCIHCLISALWSPNLLHRVLTQPSHTISICLLDIYRHTQLSHTTCAFCALPYICEALIVHILVNRMRGISVISGLW